MDAIVALLNIARVVNALVDAGERTSISETKEHVFDGTFFEWLFGLFPSQTNALELSSYYTLNKAEVLETFTDCAAVNTELNGGYDISNNGLTMIIAYCIQAVQQLLCPSP